MKISLVTISYNQCSYLKETLDSVLDQGYPDLEYIVVDPGSTDGSRELIESYRDRLSHLLLEPDKGAADGLNKGFAVATGEIYGFLNSDDLLIPGSLQRVADFFFQYSEHDLLMGNGYIIDADGHPVRHIRARDFTLSRYCCGGTDWLQQSTFFRRGLFCRSERFNIENRTCWDHELFANMSSLGASVGYLNEDLSLFRIHRTSITGSGRFKEQYYKDFKRVFARYQGHSWGPIDSLRKQAYRVERLFIRAKYGIQATVNANATSLRKE